MASSASRPTPKSEERRIDMSEPQKLERIQRQNRFLRIALVLVMACVSGLALFAQARPTVMTGSIGRYVYITGPLDKVFDTETGRVFLWMPPDKMGESPFLIVRDSINATAVEKPIRFTSER